VRRLGIVLTVVVSAGVLSTSFASRGPASVSASPRDGSARVEASSDTFIAIGIDEPQGHLNMLILGQKNEGDYFTYLKFDLPLDRIGEGATDQPCDNASVQAGPHAMSMTPAQSSSR